MFVVSTPSSFIRFTSRSCVSCGARTREHVLSHVFAIRIKAELGVLDRSCPWCCRGRRAAMFVADIVLYCKRRHTATVPLTHSVLLVALFRGRIIDSLWCRVLPALWVVALWPPGPAASDALVLVRMRPDSLAAVQPCGSMAFWLHSFMYVLHCGITALVHARDKCNNT